MENCKFQTDVIRTANLTGDITIDMAIACLGIASEAGEVLNLIRKHIEQGHVLDLKKVIDELGDLMFYIAELANVLGVELDTILEYNVEKRFKRYPDGFDKERSINREV